jgi:poly(A) polymerase
MKLSELLESVNDKTLENATEIVRKLQDAGYKDSYFVGGYVRDKLLGLDKAKDIDIATSAKPEEIKKVIKEFIPQAKFIEVGEAFNIVMVIIDSEQYEIASFRSDNYRIPKFVRKIK